MTSMTGVRQRLSRASCLPELLDAAYDAFEDMLTVIRQHDDPGSGWFTPMVMAAASAANGRDAVGWAPLLPLRRLHPDQPAEIAGRPQTAQAAAAWVAGLCEMLAGRLDAGAAPYADPGDAAACRDAVGCAREIHALMGGGAT
jgi:hypothetical protein